MSEVGASVRRGGGARAAIALGLSLFVAGAHGADLKNFISDLYGGDGITLDRFGPFPHNAHFIASGIEALSKLNNQITSGLGTFAFNSTVSSFTFDVTRGVPVRSTESFGPLLAERASTLGEGKLNVAFSYTDINYDHFDGTSLNDVKVILPHQDVFGPGFGPPDGILGPPGPAFELDQIQVDIHLHIEQQIYNFFATYGLTNNWDVGAIVPVVNIDARATAHADIIDNSGSGVHRFNPSHFGDAAVSETGGSRTGIGDVVLRSKYLVSRDKGSRPDFAVLGQVTLPSGDSNNLLGTGDTSFLGLLIASKQLNRWTPHVNLGYEASTDSTRSNLRYAVGFDTSIVRNRLTGAVDILGRWFHKEHDPKNHLVDLAVGAKWAPFGNGTPPLNANVILPLNAGSGLRSKLIWSVGIEYTF